MCQVSSGELGLLDRHIDLGIDSIECALEWAVDGAEGRKRGGKAWAQQAVVEASEEQGGAEAPDDREVCEAVEGRPRRARRLPVVTEEVAHSRH